MTEPPRRKPWSFAYALYRLVQVHEIMGEFDKVIATVDHLIAVQPESRYVPLAQMRKIQAIKDSDKSPVKAIEDFRKMIDAKHLGNRWRIEADLATVITAAETKGALEATWVAAIKSGRSIKDVHGFADPTPAP